MFVSKPSSQKQERLRALVENPRRRRFWAARSRRRQAVAACAFATVLAAVLFSAAVVTGPPTSTVLVIGFALSLGASAVLSTHINIAARWVVGYEGVDEFQQAEMDRAASLGHNVTAALLTLLVAVTCGFGGWLSLGNMDARIPLTVLVPLVVLTTMCHAAFPACYLAWTRPDEIPGDEGDEDA
ncbi:hypothetical protein [Nocardiopsis alborubida]|uniref:Uncharacterized protein n=1 Tax=Nocardiopsis alborubida TaxID=146802 RepID=A0A7X6MJ10_9ACTN|nr:hypothetical protein [Nocardiopsis alborubida]NKZ00649.1 hypothetical protein [Nocardiopsis alborubida]